MRKTSVCENLRPKRNCEFTFRPETCEITYIKKSVEYYTTPSNDIITCCYIQLFLEEKQNQCTSLKRKFCFTALV